jgi:hypothetical protein
MFIKRKLDPDSIDFSFYLISSTSMDGVLLQKYYDKEFDATPEQIIRFKLSNTLWRLKYEQKEMEALLDTIIDIAKKIKVYAGKNFEIFPDKNMIENEKA